MTMTTTTTTLQTTTTTTRKRKRIRIPIGVRVLRSNFSFFLYFLSSVATTAVTAFCSKHPLRSPKITTTTTTKPFSFSLQSSSNIQQLGGQGNRAVVREGCVLLPPAHEFHHYYKSSALFVYDIGYDDDQEEILIRAVVLDNPTPFCLSEMIRTSSSSTPDSSDDLGLLSSHLLFRGGGTDDGNNPNSSIVWFHNVPELNDEEIGEYNSGVYRGTSWRRAVEVMESHNNEQQRHPLFKFFFNYVEFRQQELEDLLEDGSDSHDGWVSLTIPSGMILDNSYDKNDCWTRLRNIMKQQQQQEQ